MNSLEPINIAMLHGGGGHRKSSKCSKYVMCVESFRRVLVGTSAEARQKNMKFKDHHLQ